MWYLEAKGIKALREEGGIHSIKYYYRLRKVQTKYWQLDWASWRSLVISPKAILVGGIQNSLIRGVQEKMRSDKLGTGAGRWKAWSWKQLACFYFDENDLMESEDLIKMKGELKKFNFLNFWRKWNENC